MRKDPNHLAYVNLYPNYASAKQLQTKGNRVDAYREFLNKFIDIVKPQLLSFDHYNFAVKGQNDAYFLNLAQIREAALKENIPFMAALQGYYDVAKLLLESNADVNLQIIDGGTALNAAAINGHADIVKLLLKSKVDMNAQDNEGATALHMASQKGYPEIVKLLLINNAKVNVQRNDGTTALMLATWREDIEIVKLLVKGKADVNLKEKIQNSYTNSRFHVRQSKILFETIDFHNTFHNF